ncbi:MULTISPECIES: hypothetical protein [Bacteria]|jgi:hypothetical protein|uniref:hypothetical protein n=1 Tax=Bacteria TaxID=2 RepID=UPI0024306FFF|nr:MULTISPECIES: hypothetical protein [Bacteria]
MKVIANVKREPGEKNFSCYMNITELKTGVLGLGSSAKAAINDMMSGWQDAVADFKDDGIEAPELEIEYRFDVGSLFSFYDFVNIAGVAREIGINPSVMRQYAIGTRKPSTERKAEIMTGFKRLALKMQNAVLF